jgi:acyl-CoA dehydrogenase
LSIFPATHEKGEPLVSSGSQPLFDTAAKLFSELVTPSALAKAAAGGWLSAEWQHVEELGLPQALIPESMGGFGIDPTDALTLIKIAGAHALPLPLAETMMASWFLAHAGLAVAEGPLTVAAGVAPDVTLESISDGWRLKGSIPRVPWAAKAKAFLVILEISRGRSYAVLLEQGHWRSERGANLAGEPRNTVRFEIGVRRDAVRELPPHIGPREVRLLGAAMHSCSIAGALEKVLALTVQYAGERVQFGRPIAKFQAIQQNLAVLAGETAAAVGAAGLAAEAAGDGLKPLAIAAAKIRAGEAAGIGAAIAHQVHGAIGFTQDHQLHHFTQRLWSWRDEYGGEAEWSQFLGRDALASGRDGLWPLVTTV